MFQAILPLSFVSIAIFPLMNAISCSFRLSPLADIAVAKDSLPYALALFEATAPFALVNFSIGPSVDALPMWFSV